MLTFAKNKLFFKNKRFSLYFVVPTETFYVIGPIGQIQLSKKVYKYTTCGLSLKQELNTDVGSSFSLKLFFTSLPMKNLFLNTLKNALISVSFGYLKEFVITGIGYKNWFGGNRIIYDLGCSHYFSLKIPNKIIAKCKKNGALFYSCDPVALGNFVAKLNWLKKKDSYKGKGVKLLGIKTKLKPGKQR